MPRKPYKLDKVAIRMVKEPPLYSEKPMNCAEAVIELMRDVLREYDREVLCVVNLKTNLVPINLNICSMGVVDGSVAHPLLIYSVRTSDSPKNEYGDYIGRSFLAASFFYFIFHEGGSVYE